MKYCKVFINEFACLLSVKGGGLRVVIPAGSGMSKLALLALLFYPVVSAGSNESASAADNATPELGVNRLFVGHSQRRQLDSLKEKKGVPAVDTEPVLEPVLGPVVAPKTVKPVAKVTRPPVVNPPEEEPDLYYLNGFVRRSNGLVDVWINGKAVPALPDVNLINVESNGVVLLRIQGKKYSLYPGQSVQVVRATTERSSDLVSRKTR